MNKIEAVQHIIDGKIVAIFQGQSEWGPRALGNRSILFDPRNPDAKDIVNKVKRREWYRPFAGTILLEHANNYFEMWPIKESPYMSYAIPAKQRAKELVPGIIHADGTCRIQTVTRKQNRHFYELIEEFYKTVDLMIVASSRLRGHETRDMSLKLPDNIIQIDIDPKAKNRTYKTKMFHCGDAQKVLNELSNRLSNQLTLDKEWENEISQLKNKILEDYKRNLGAYKDFPEIVRKVLPENGMWVRDVTISNSMWGNRSMFINEPQQNIYPVGAAIGPGMALAIGASIGSKGNKTIAMCGDGGFMLNLPDLWTAVETNCDVVFLVMNDQGYGVIKHIQESMYGGRKFYADLIGPNFEELAKAAKIKYSRIDHANDLEKKLKQALNFLGPVLLEVNVHSVGEMPRYFAPPPHAQKD